jgi:hypothetical protein
MTRPRKEAPGPSPLRKVQNSSSPSLAPSPSPSLTAFRRYDTSELEHASNEPLQSRTSDANSDNDNYTEDDADTGHRENRLVAAEKSRHCAYPKKGVHWNDGKKGKSNADITSEEKQKEDHSSQQSMLIRDGRGKKRVSWSDKIHHDDEMDGIGNESGTTKDSNVTNELAVNDDLRPRLRIIDPATVLGRRKRPDDDLDEDNADREGGQPASKKARSNYPWFLGET